MSKLENEYFLKRKNILKADEIHLPDLITVPTATSSELEEVLHVNCRISCASGGVRTTNNVTRNCCGNLMSRTESKYQVQDSASNERRLTPSNQIPAS